MASTQSFSNNEALDLPELAPHHPSQDFSGEILFWDDFSPLGPCLSNPWAQLREDIWSGDSEDEMIIGDEPNAACQVHPAKVAGLIISDISQTGQLNGNSDVEDNDKFMSYHVSSLLESGPCAEMVGLD